MRITFVLNSIGLSGGTRVVFEYANHLYQRGHDVTIVYPLMPLDKDVKWYQDGQWYGMLKTVTKNLIQGRKPRWFDVKATVLRVPSLSERYIPDGDIIVATWWSTAYDVAGYGPKKGEKFYLVQHYETWGGPKDTVDASYKLGLKIITVSNWIKNIIENNLNGSVAAVISNAPNQNEFFPDRKTANQRVRILTPYRKEKWKGFEDAVQVFIKVKKQHPNVKLVTFGQYSGRDIPEDFEYHQGPIGEKLRHLYSSSDVFLFSSHSEGFGLPPMEAMACKCAVVTTNVGAIPDFSVPGETALVSPPGDIDTLAENLLTLIEDADKRTRFAEKGYEYIKQFTWGHSCDELETLFKTSLTTYEINLKGSSWNMH